MKAILNALFLLSALCPLPAEETDIQALDVYITPLDPFYMDENTLFASPSEARRRFVRCPHCGRWYNPQKGHDICRGPE